MEVGDALAAIVGGQTGDDVESRTLEFKREGRSRVSLLRGAPNARPLQRWGLLTA